MTTPLAPSSHRELLPELSGPRAPGGAGAPVGVEQSGNTTAGRRQGCSTKENTWAQPDPLKGLAPAGNGIVFQRALREEAGKDGLSLMLLGTGQMVSEPGCCPPLCEGLARGAGYGSCFDFMLIWQPACCTGPAPRRVPPRWGTKPRFHLVIARPDVTAPVQSCPCVTVGKPVPRTWVTLACLVVQPGSLLPQG